MTRPVRERWTFTVELPADVGHRGGRFMARLLKHLLRAWGVKCVALRDPDMPATTHHSPSAASQSNPSTATPEEL